MVLVCGFPRSGTTWLSKILDSRPSVLLLHEPDKRSNQNLILGNVPHFINKENWSYYVSKYQEGIKELLHKFHPNLITFPLFRKNFINLPYSLYFSIVCFYKSLALRNIIMTFKLPVKKTSKIELVWKTTNQSCNIPFLLYTFPQLKIVYIVRNPYSAIASMLNRKEMQLNDKDDYRRICERKDSSFFKKNNIDLEYIKKLPALKKRALLWRVNCESAFINGQGNPRFHWITYENLCKNPEKEIKSLHDFLKWDFIEETKCFINKSTGKEKSSFTERIVSYGYYGVYHGQKSFKYEKKLSNHEYKQIETIIKDSPLLCLWNK